MPKVSCLGEWRPRCVSTQMATILQQMLLNYSNIQTVALGCILLSIIICIFTWHGSRGSNAHSQQQTAFIYNQTYVLSPTDSFWGKVLIKLNSQCQASTDLALQRLRLAAGSPSPFSPPCACLHQYISDNGSRHFQPEPNYQWTFLSAGSSYTKHRMGNTLYSKFGISESSEKHPGKEEYSP